MPSLNTEVKKAKINANLSKPERNLRFIERQIKDAEPKIKREQSVLDMLIELHEKTGSLRERIEQYESVIKLGT